MNPRYCPAVSALGLLLCISCGGEARTSTPQLGAGGTGHAGNASAGDASATGARAGGGATFGGAAGRGGACGSAPKEHRAVAAACPTERGSSGPIDTTSCMNRAGITCTKDADCTAGLNGRCLAHNEPCDTECSYDECFKDSDCAAGPCLCRSEGTTTLSNQCSPSSSCKTDTDCGPCGYCSASAALEGSSCSAAPLTYACHTASDQCTDRSDCDRGYCAYDAAMAGWACGFCVPIPHP